MSIVTGTIWHFSDFHLDARNPIGSPDVKRDVGDSAPRFFVPGFDALLRFIDDEAKERPRSRTGDILAISGDLVHKGNWSDPLAVSWIIEAIRKRLGLPKSRVLVVPGNHDVTWRNAKLPRAKMRSAFNRATRGYVKPMKTFKSVDFPSAGLSFVLADTVSLAGAEVGVEPVLRAFRDHCPAAVRPTDRRILEHRLAEALREDIASIPTTELQRALEKLGGGQLPPNRLGILLAHHPLTPHPFGPVEIKPFDVAIAAGQAKTMLAKYGFHLCLHGHHHSHVTVSEETHGSAAGFEFFNVASASLTQQPENGFNIIRYALATKTGEAIVSILSAALTAEGVGPPREVRRAYIPPRVGVRTESVRISERINIHGDARTDMWFSEVPTKGWRKIQGKRILEIPCMVESLGAHLDSTPQVQALTPHTTASFAVQVPSDSNDESKFRDLEHIRGTIKLSAPMNARAVSFAYRFLGNHSYSTSIVARVRSSAVPTDIPSLLYNEECLLHVARGSAKRLEIFVRTPGRAPSIDAVRVCCFCEYAGEKLVRSADLEALTSFTVETWPEAKRIRLTIDHPMRDVGYGLIWGLQRQEPGLESKTENEKGATITAEIVRSGIFRARHQVAKWRALNKRYFDPTFDTLTSLVNSATGAKWTSKDLEFSLFFRENEIFDSMEFEDRIQKGVRLKRPSLRLIAGNFPANDRRLSVKLRAGVGVAGRAYATNRPVSYDALQSRSGRRAHRLFVSPYLTLKADEHLPRHDVLYAFPLRHWEDDGVVLGCVCIGTRGHGTRLNLEGNKTPERTWGEDVLEIGRDLIKGLADFL